jgi:aspartyl/asparaginyl-tRNA synthetase
MLPWCLFVVMQNQNFMHIHTPILTALDCEGAGELFGTPFTKIYVKLLECPLAS